MSKKLGVIYTPEAHPGFLGRDHLARHVIGGDFSQSDPFIILADDVLDKKTTEPVGGPHPHAGFETVTLLLEGELGAGDHRMEAGDFQMMTAGSGIIHTETIDKKLKMRLLQLWLTLPKKNRWVTPRIQDLPLRDVPAKSENGMNLRVYSGTFAGVSSPVLNYVPLILADIRMEPGVKLHETIPGNYNTFMYMIEGEVKVGKADHGLQKDQAGWLDRSAESDQLELVAGASGARIILYSAERQGDDIVSHGPFIGNNEDDIRRLYREYREGKMKHVSTLPREQALVW
jgi:quercetin 2,3-dioxygenase